MRYLGSGGCSAVFALSSDEEREMTLRVRQAVGHGGEDAHRLKEERLALRVSRVHISVCPTCARALADFMGFRHDVLLTDELRKECALACPLLADHCRTAVHACLIPNFALDPALLLCGQESVRWLTVEIKPKAIWRQPRVVGIAVDGVNYYLHPVKLRQCRFSLMQLLKRERRNEGIVVPSETGCMYCPNQLLVGDQLAIADGLRNLIRHPANNLRLISGENFFGEFQETDLDALSAALHTSGVFDVLTNLQLYGSSTASEWEVLDVELLHRWSSVRDASTVRWIVRDACASTFSKCACQSGTSHSWNDTEDGEHAGTRHVVPPMDMEECESRFYTSTTAKDVSVLVALSTGAGASAAAAVGLTDGPKDVVRWNSPHGGVCVDFGFPTASVCRVGVVDVDEKRHKSLGHYFAHDREVLMAWERWKDARTSVLR